MKKSWAPIGLFTIFAALNMLDRQLLAAAAPAIRREFGLSNAQYGLLGSAFSAASTFAAPVAGLLFDRLGLTLAAVGSLFVWSLAGIGTGLSSGFRGLLTSRFVLAVGESGAGAAPGVVVASYVTGEEMGIAAAFLAGGTSIGAIAAPLVTATLASRYGWRTSFLVCGVAGLLWIPLWTLTSRIVPPTMPARRRSRVSLPGLFGDRRFWGFIVAYALARQTLWVTWTTLYFVDARHLSMVDANRQFSWMPSVFGAAGAFIAGAAAMRWMNRGMSGVNARLTACWVFAPLILCSIGVPFVDSNRAAAILIGLSFLGNVCVWSSVHLMPIDIYGIGRSGFTYAVLEGSFTGLQVIAAPTIGFMIDRYGYTLMCMVMPLVPLAGIAFLALCLASFPREALDAA